MRLMQPGLLSRVNCVFVSRIKHATYYGTNLPLARLARYNVLRRFLLKLNTRLPASFNRQSGCSSFVLSIFFVVACGPYAWN